MNNELQDKQYLALELTKILFSDKCKYTNKQVYESYLYFFANLMESFDEINTITSLKNEIAKLQKENEQLKANNQDVLRPFKDHIIKIANGGKGDMEPYVYTALMNVCEKDI